MSLNQGSVVVIYSDRSWKDKKTSSAFVALQNRKVIKEDKSRLRGTGTSYDAEVIALERAVTWACNNNRDQVVNTDIVFCVDNKAALQMPLGKLPKTNRDSYYNIVQSLEKLLEENNDITVHFYWTPGHVGILGNERADRLAEKARVDGVELDTSTILGEKLASKAETIKNWCTNRGIPKSSSGWALAYSTPSFALRSIIKNRKHKREHVAQALQVITGHCYCGAYYEKMKIKNESPLCLKCGVIEDR